MCVWNVTHKSSKYNSTSGTKISLDMFETNGGSGCGSEHAPLRSICKTDLRPRWLDLCLHRNLVTICTVLPKHTSSRPGEMFGFHQQYENRFNNAWYFRLPMGQRGVRYLPYLSHPLCMIPSILYSKIGLDNSWWVNTINPLFRLL